MEDVLNTPAEAGTQDVQSEQTDTAPDWDYYDPDEDTVETPDAEATDDDGNVSEEEDPETTEDPEPEVEAEEEEAEDAPVLVEMPDGTKMEQGEVVKGYLRQADYTRKSTETAQSAKRLTRH